jgi:peptide chain release factor 3
MTNFGVELFLQTFLHYAQHPMTRTATLEYPVTSSSFSSSTSSSENQDNDHKIIVDNFSLTAKSTPTTPSLLSTGNSITIDPQYPEFTGFIFKLQANLDPKHRDRMAFLRICSGIFQKGIKVNHSRMKKTINLSSAQSLFAQDREAITIAYPGDVIGIHNPGYFAIGDTIYTGNKAISFPGIPSFSPEKFAYIRNLNPANYKKYQKVSISTIFITCYL